MGLLGFYALKSLKSAVSRETIRYAGGPDRCFT